MNQTVSGREISPEIFGSSTALEEKRIRAANFINLLSTVESIAEVSIKLDFDEENPVDNAIRSFINTEETHGKLYLDPSVSYLAGDNDQPITFRPARARGRKSQHGVFFGGIYFGDSVLPVAVKPYWIDAKVDALRDHINSVAVRRLGIETLQPAGFMIEDDNKAYVMTVRDETVSTLDTTDWSHFYPNFEQNPGMVETWGHAARQMALIHSVGKIRHVDPAGRNIAQTTDGAVFLMDWEKSLISARQPRDAETRFSYSYPDLECLLESLCFSPEHPLKAGLGIFAGKEGDTWQGFSDLFLDEYCQYKEAYADQGPHHRQTLRDVREELDQLRTRLKTKMPTFLEEERELQAQRRAPNYRF